MKRVFLNLIVWLFAVSAQTFAQNFAPLPVTGFNNDIVAETGTSSLAVTSTNIDGSNNVIYSANFATVNGILGGVPNTGTITNGIRSFQMAAFNANNALYLSAGSVANTTTNGTLTLTTPAVLSKISLLLFSTEGTSSINAELTFTDGTVQTMPAFSVVDWFNGANAVISSVGRIARVAAGPYVADGRSTSNPRFYSYDILIACANQSKSLASIKLNFLGGAASTRAVILAVSGISYTPLSLTNTFTPAICGGINGSITLNATGGTAPLTYSWNTTPVQTTPVATNLPAGTYTCTIKDANNCITTFQKTLDPQSQVTLTATAAPASICSGASSTLSVTAGGGTASNYTWTPGNTSGTGVTVTPAATTIYTVEGKDAFGCVVKSTVQLTVKPTPTADFVIDEDNVCLGTVQTLTYTGVAGTAATFNWNNFDGATVQSGTGKGPYDIVFLGAGNHTLQLQVTDNGCVSSVKNLPVVIAQPPLPDFSIGKTTLCSGTTTVVTFTGVAGTSAVPAWNWGGGQVQSGTGFGPFLVKYQQPGTIQLTVKEGACTVSSAIKPVAVIQMPQADFTTDKVAACPPADIVFTNQSQGATAYEWHFGDGNTAVSEHAQYSYTAPGAYTVMLVAIAQGQCSDTLTQVDLINILATPVAGFGSVPGTNVPQEYTQAFFNFNNQSQSATKYVWDFGDGTTSAAANPVHHYALPGSYQVTLIAANGIGCSDTATDGWYVVVPDKVLKVPNAFSPNRDGINDRWVIEGLNAFPGCRVEVFNRWGQSVFTSRGYATPWDGMRNGNPLPMGTYYYVITTNAGRKPYSGWVAIVR